MTQPPQASVRTDLRWLAEIVGLALLYVGTARLGQWFAIAPGNITPVWIPSGIILAAVWCRGYRLWPGIFLGAFAGNAWAYWSTESAAALGKCLLAASANGLGDSLCAVAGVYLIRRTTGGRNPLHRAADMLHLILYGGVLATGISAVCGVTSLSLTGLLPWSQYGHALWTWWVGGGMGVLVFTPLLLAWSGGWRGCRCGREELAALACVAGYGLWIVPQPELILLFLALPLLMWGVCRFDPRVSLAMIAVVAALAILALGVGRGPLSGTSSNVPNLQLFLATLTVPLLLLQGALAERHQSAADDSRTGWVFVAIAALLAACIVGIGHLFYLNYQRKYHIAIEQDLTLTAQLKVDGLMQYRKERLGDGAVFFHNVSFTALVRRVLDSPGDADAHGQLQDWLGNYRSAYQYDRVFLLDVRGATRLSVPEAPEPDAALVSRKASELLGSDQVAMLDFYRDEHNQRAYLAVMVPVCDGSGPARRPLEVLVLRIDPDTRLNPFIQRWPQSSPSAETELVRREGDAAIYLNTLRLRPDAAMNLRIPLGQHEIPAIQAVLGQTGTRHGVDYRGVPVLAAALAVPDTPWLLLVKRDAAEAYAPMRKLFWQVWGVPAILLFGVAASAGLVWRQYLDRVLRERTAAVEGQRLSEERYRFLFENSMDGFAHCQMLYDERDQPVDFIYLNVNRAFEQLTGLQNVIGKRVTEVIPGMHEAEPELLEPYSRVALTGHSERFEVHFQPLKQWFVVTAYSQTKGCFIATFDDITEHKQAELALLANEQRFRQLFEANVMPIAYWNMEGLFTDANGAWCQLADIAPELVRAGGSSWQTITPPEMLARDRVAIQEIQATGLCQPYEKDFMRGEGSRVTVQISGAMLVGSTTEGIAFAVDLTERKQAEQAQAAALAEKTVLLREIHHRVKNNLQIISSLLRLQSEQIEAAGAKTVLLDMQNRIHSMALIHEHLYSSANLGEVDLSAYLQSLCLQLFHALVPTPDIIHLHLNLAHVRLGIDQAIPCGILVNELVTNAFKHAFPGGRGGDVWIELQAPVETPGWRLRVADNGVGLPADFDFDQLTSMGAMLASALIGQLNGRLEIGAGPGAVFDITFRPNGNCRANHGPQTRHQ